MPAVAFLAEQRGFRKQRVLEYDLVEMMLPGQRQDRPDCDARRISQIHQKLAETRMPVVRRTGTAEQNHVMREMRETGPDLGAVDQISALDLHRPRADGGEIGAD